MRRWIITGIILMILGIILGAFGAHGLKTQVHSEQSLIAFETAVRYQIVHALAFLIIPFIISFFRVSDRIVYTLLLSGVILFSGSIYMLVIKDVLQAEVLRFAGPITPFGGLMLIAGWSVFLFKIVKSRG